MLPRRLVAVFSYPERPVAFVQAGYLTEPAGRSSKPRLDPAAAPKLGLYTVAEGV
jgi:hypothetical protein